MVDMNPQMYTVKCSEANHVPGAAPNLTEYKSAKGLIEKP